ncbi:peptide chain release factor N(5)-glutamine methyltransferase [Campylobacter sp. MIT 99-7217]|uniref:HemK/PrmC family methyltransferase n=1 Tax=Campylobacter sp. MIT 99-7217 TaxID=535091 RepID=UPI0011598BBF|nr:HemK/PrmC family methyltransferase [Campylobacter sp. MIT 99-7217]TQR34727.1 peptide chain release factor N(5)-glutamine methyltransferase [Campylobacter sp. MIT 99-7217]
MKIKDALKISKKLLQNHENEAVFFLCEYLACDKSWLFLNEHYDFDEKPFFALIDRFLQGEPFEYIFKKASFYGLDFYMQKGVLIPRFDSEILLELVRKELVNNPYKKILEIGFGSGILSIVLAKLTQKKITACDVSKKALNLAIKNARLHKVEDLIDFRLCDFKDMQDDFDLIFSNPPYIAKNYPLDQWVLKEPKKALFGGIKGHEILEKIILFAKAKKAKCLACEFGFDQKEILHEILVKNGFEAKFYKDYQGFDRAFCAKIA